MSTSLTGALVAEFRRRVFEESIPRINRCLSLLTPEQVWYKPAALVNSPGNLVLHLEGNARQWVLAGLFGENDHRNRDWEFAFEGEMPAAELTGRLARLQAEIDVRLDALTEADLLRSGPVQIYEETGLSILVHVIEHFSYHTGQIAWFTKWISGKDTGFYEGQPL
jgi:uncharacterized damage-inducible protein DinB